MSTTYYYTANPPCDCCGRPYAANELGHSAAGWVFTLYLYPSQGLNSLADWEARWTAGGTITADGHTILPAEMKKIITERQGMPFDKEGRWRAYGSETDFHASNRSQRGPNGLLRGRPTHDYHVVAGDGTYDMIERDWDST